MNLLIWRVKSQLSGSYPPMHEPRALEQLVKQFASTAALSDVHVLYRDYETRSCALLKKVGLYKYATDPSTEVRVVVYAVDDGPMQLWPLGNPPPPEFVEAARNLGWLVVAHNDQFESAIEQYILAPRLRLPLDPAGASPLHHGCGTGPWAAGEVENHRRCNGVQQSKRCRRRTAHAPDEQAAAAAQR